MAYQQNPDGTVTIIDDAGRMAPFTVPPHLAPPLPSKTGPLPAPPLLNRPPTPNTVEPGQYEDPSKVPQYYIDPNTSKTVETATGKPVSPSAALIAPVRPQPSRTQELDPLGYYPGDEPAEEAEPAETVAPPAAGKPRDPLAGVDIDSLSNEEAIGMLLGWEVGPKARPQEEAPKPAAEPAPEPTQAPSRRSTPAATDDPLYMDPGFQPPPREAPNALAQLDPGLNVPGMPTDISGLSAPQSDVEVEQSAQKGLAAAGLPRTASIKLAEPAPPRAAVDPAPPLQPGLSPTDRMIEVETRMKSGWMPVLDKSGNPVLDASGNIQWRPKPATGGRLVKEDTFVPGATTVKPGKKLPLETAGALAKSYLKQTQQARQAGDQRAAAITEAAVGEAEVREQALQRIADIRDEQRSREKALKPKIAAVEARMARIRELSDTDPIDRYYQRKGAAASILATIGAALINMGTFSAKGTELLNEKIKGEIDQEIAAQKLALESERSNLEGQLSVLGEMRQLFLSPDAAEMATRGMLHEAAAAQSRSLAATIDSADAKAKADEIAEAHMLEGRKFLAEAALAEQDALTIQGKIIPKGTVIGGSPGAKTNMEMAAHIVRTSGGKINFLDAMNFVVERKPLPRTGEDTRAGVEKQKWAVGRQVPVPPGLQKLIGVGPVLYDSQTREGKENMGAKLAQYDNYLRDMNELLQLSKDKGFLLKLWSEDRAKAEALVSRALYAAKYASMGEAFTAGEEPLWRPLVGDPTKFFSFMSNSRAQIEANIGVVRADAVNDMRRLYVSPDAHPASNIGALLDQGPPGAKPAPGEAPR